MPDSVLKLEVDVGGADVGEVDVKIPEEDVEEELVGAIVVEGADEVEVVAGGAGFIVEIEVDVGGTTMEVEEAGGPSPN